ncbi:MAG: dienelactone hydrolase family protein [Saccharospirillum sp.]|nr:dienelactone hydrolase family protein [Saccharospirillum sp.]
MSETLTLTASDQHHFSAYQATPEGEPKGAVVVLQEIFGVNDHIRSVCDRLATDGYVACAPSLFDRIQPGWESAYDDAGVASSRELMGKFNIEQSLDDIQATIDHLKPFGNVATIGFCLGGSLAYLIATLSTDLSCAVGYYGGRIPEFADQKPRCPTILHFGEQDAGIPLEKVDIIRQHQSELPIYLYPAGHGFNCDARSAYEPESAKVAWQRTMAFLKEHL